MRLFPGLCIVVLFAGAIWLFWIGLGQMLSANASKSWPSVTGTIVSAGFETSGSGQNYSRNAFVQYRYSVDGTNYSHDRISFGPNQNFKVDGTLESARHQAIKDLATKVGGSSVNVHYDPDDPATAVLLPGGGLFFLIYLFGSALMVAVAVIVFLIATGRTNIPIYRR